MPWCPKCKNEYREGITECVDCGSPLVESLEEYNDSSEPLLLLQSEKKDYLEKFVKYLDYSGIHSYSIKPDENEFVWSLYVNNKDYKQAHKLYKGFALTESELELEERAKNAYMESIEADTSSEDDSSDEELPVYEELDASNIPEEYYQKAEDSEKTSFSTDNEQISDMFDDETVYESYGSKSPENTYVRQSDRAKDYKFSAYTCIFFGFFGSIFAIVNLLGFIDLIPALFSQIVMLFVFIAFLIGGIIMYINSKSIEQNAATEETLEKELDEWLDMNITESYIYQLKDNSSSDEINYFRYFEAIKQDVLKDFPEAPAAMIDALIDEHLNSLV
ncbi:MAG: hypothetical protein MR001_01945 [Lachnoclostridium sp.]|nr:hypothetical protein [Lachnoclostridium sp.]